MRKLVSLLLSIGILSGAFIGLWQQTIKKEVKWQWK